MKIPLKYYDEKQQKIILEIVVNKLHLEVLKFRIEKGETFQLH
jgi:hypothetical protein